MVKLILVILMLSPYFVFGQDQETAEAVFGITSKSLKTLANEVIPAFERHSGYKFKKTPTIKLSSTDEIAIVLTEELKLQFENVPDAPSAKAQSEAIAPAIMGKYGYKNHVIFVNGPAIKEMSKLIAMPKLRRRDSLAAILIHELCHAMDHEKFGVMTKMHGVTKPETLTIWGHLIEGHAQYVARSVCQKHGLKDAFEVFTKSLGTLPAAKEKDSVVRLLQQARVDLVIAQYYDGESFFHEIHELGGDKAVERVFVSPPKSSMDLTVPAWYLDPSLRRQAPDFDKVVDTFSKEFVVPWKATKISLSAQQFKGVFAVLKDPKRVGPIIEKIRANRGVAMVVGRGEKLVTLIVMDHRSAANAQKYVRLTVDLFVRKDELMKDGPAELKSSTYYDISGDHWRGKMAVKVIVIQEVEVEFKSAIIACGQYALEFMYSNEPIEKKRLESKIGAVVDELIASVAQPK